MGAGGVVRAAVVRVASPQARPHACRRGVAAHDGGGRFCDRPGSDRDLVGVAGGHDLVPNLVETVKGYATHEREVFDRVTKARADAMRANGVNETQAAEGQLTGAITDILQELP